MTDLSADPYEGARRAYKILHPDSSSQGWEDWLAAAHREANGEFDNFGALAILCREASACGTETDPKLLEHISYSCGYFEAIASIMRSLLVALPISSSVPHHMTRYRRSLINPDAQFD